MVTSSSLQPSESLGFVKELDPEGWSPKKAALLLILSTMIDEWTNFAERRETCEYWTLGWARESNLLCVEIMMETMMKRRMKLAQLKCVVSVFFEIMVKLRRESPKEI